MNKYYTMLRDFTDRSNANKLALMNREEGLQQQRVDNQLASREMTHKEQKQEHDMQAALVGKAMEFLMYADTPEKAQSGGLWMKQHRPNMYQALGGDAGLQGLLQGDYLANRNQQLAIGGKWMDAQKAQREGNKLSNLMQTEDGGLVGLRGGQEVVDVPIPSGSRLQGKQPLVKVSTAAEPVDPRKAMLAEDTAHRAQGARAHYDELITAGRKSSADIARYNRILTLLETVQTGPLQKRIRDAKRLANAVGAEFPDIEKAEELEVFLGDEIMSRVAQTKGAVSEKEMALFTEYSANYGKTTEGNRQIIAFKKAKAERDRTLSKMAIKMQKQGKTMLEIQEAIDDYINDPANDLRGYLQPPAKPEASGTGEMSDAELLEALSK